MGHAGARYIGGINHKQHAIILAAAAAGIHKIEADLTGDILVVD